jgi:hypothetical protein
MIGEQPRTPERKEPAKFIDLFELSEKESDLLRKRIEENCGTIRMVIHPFFRKPENIDIVTDDKVRRLVRIQNAIKRLTALNSKHTPPIIFMEDAEEINELEKRLIGLAKGKIYFVRTAHKSPRPLDPLTPPTRLDDASIEGNLAGDPKSWRLLIETLQCLGVKKIIIGGENLYITENRDDPESRNAEYPFPVAKVKLGGCAGTTIKQLRKIFDVSFSCLAFPDSREDLRETERSLKKYYGDDVEIIFE